MGYFQSDYFKLITLIALLVPMMVHTANLLLQLSVIKNPWYAYFFAFAFDLGIFVFSINGRTNVAVGLGFIVFLLNVCFFNLPYFYTQFGESQVKLAITIIISGSAAFILKYYVNFFNKKEEHEIEDLTNEKYALQNKIQILEIGNNNLQQKNNDLISELREIKAVQAYQASIRNEKSEVSQISSSKIEEAEKIKYPYVCEKGCDQSFSSEQSHNNAKKFCKFCTQNPLANTPKVVEDLVLA